MYTANEIKEIFGYSPKTYIKDMHKVWSYLTCVGRRGNASLYIISNNAPLGEIKTYILARQLKRGKGKDMIKSTFVVPLSGGNTATIQFDRLPLKDKDVEAIKQWFNVLGKNLTEGKEKI